MKIKSLIHTGYAGKKINPGDLIEMEDREAKTWIVSGFGKPIKEPKIAVVKKAKKVKKNGAGSGDGFVSDASGCDDICRGELRVDGDKEGIVDGAVDG